MIRTEPTLRHLFDLLKEEIFTELNCHAIGTIESFDETNQLARVSIAYSKFSETDTVTTKNFPLLLDIPVMVLGGGKSSVQFPIISGDSCVVLFNDRNIDNWLSGGKNAVLSSNRKHNIADGIAMVGIRSLQESLTGYSTTKTKIVHDETVITLSDKVKINNATQNLYTILDGVLGILAAFSSTNCVVGAPVLLSPAQIVQVNAFKTQLSQLME